MPSMMKRDQSCFQRGVNHLMKSFTSFLFKQYDFFEISEETIGILVKVYEIFPDSDLLLDFQSVSSKAYYYLKCSRWR